MVKMSLCLIMQRATKMYGGDERQLHAFLVWALYRGYGKHSGSTGLTKSQQPPVPISKRLNISKLLNGS
jgi:hypothetical protein